MSSIAPGSENSKNHPLVPSSANIATQNRTPVTLLDSNPRADYWRREVTSNPHQESPYRLATPTEALQTNSRFNQRDFENKSFHESKKDIKQNLNALAGARVKPKDFSKPVTCYYWATKGSCNKSNEECSYAHYWTEVIASAPVKLTSAGVSVAGREAERIVAQAVDRDDVLRAREQMVALRESKIASETAHLEKLVDSLRGWTGKLGQELSHIGASTRGTIEDIEHRRNELYRMCCDPAHNDGNVAKVIEHAVHTLDKVLDRLIAQKTHNNAVSHRLQVTQGWLEDMNNTKSTN